MVIDDVLEHNKAFARGRRAEPLPDTEGPPLAVVACYDPRLDSLLREALGLAPGRAVLIRTAGAHVSRTGDPLRSLALACIRFGATEVLVCGHTSCRMAPFDTAAFVEEFRRRGIAREAFGHDDLRLWCGAAASPKRGVLTSVSAILAARFFPADTRVTGAVLDDTSGVLEVVYRPGEPVPGFEMPGTVEPPAADTTSGGTVDEPAVRSQSQSARPTPTRAGPAAGAVEAALALATRLQSKARLRDEALRLRTEVAVARHPIEKLRLVEAFLKRAAGDAREVRVALDDLRRRSSGTAAADVADEVVRRITDLAREG